MTNASQMKWNLDAPWCIGSEDYDTLLSHLDRKKIHLIVELGSGQSTFQLAQDFPDAALYSLESDPNYLEKNNNDLLLHGFDNAHIVVSPPKTVNWKGAYFTTYDMQPLKDLPPIDLLIIDGPVESLFPLGREGAMYLLFDLCAKGAVIGLDDYHRMTAKRAVNNWLSTYNEALILIEETSSFAVLRKVSDCTHPEMSWSRRAQSIKATISSILKRGKRSLSNVVRNLGSN